MAVKKAGGSTKNGRDSQSKRLGLKVGNMQKIKAGQILIRQRGQKYKCGVNTYYGRDHTIHAMHEGIVIFYQKMKNTFVKII